MSSKPLLPLRLEKCNSNGNCGRGIEWILVMKSRIGEVYTEEKEITSYGVCEKCKEIYENISKSPDMKNFIVTFTRLS